MLGIVEVVLFLCVVGYFFNKNRGTDMVDVISTRVQEAYGSFRLPGTVANNHGDAIESVGFSTYAMLKRFGENYRRKKAVEKENDKKMREKSLYQIKESPTPNIVPDMKPVQGLACKHCAPSDSQSQLDPKERRRHAIDILRVTAHAGRRPNSSIFDWGIYCPHLAHVCRLKKFPYPQVAGAVMQDERMRAALEAVAKESVDERREEFGDDDESFDEDKYYNEMWKKHEKRANTILIDMRSKISDLLLRLTSWVLYKLLPCFMSGVAAHPAQIEMLKAASEKAPGAPLIFLPLHRSHLDYILISFILLNNDIKSPIVAGGDNLRIPFFGALLRGLGAFFIKRKIDPLTGKKDTIYRGVLHTYLQKCLAAGHNVEFFIEGGRTRTGKPCMPKSGILSVIVDAFMDGTVSDALLVPVSVNYEKLVDGNFIHEQLGRKKKPESFKSAAGAIINVLKSKYGLMRIDFNEPFSLRELVKSFNKSSEINSNHPSMSRRLQHQPSSSSLYGTDVVQEEQRILVDSIARHVVYDCSNATSVMTTNAVAFLLLNRFRDGATLTILTAALDELRKTLYGVRDIGFTGDSEDVIKYAADLLGPGLVTKEKRGQQTFIKPVVMVPNVIELSYYSNSVIPHFALESIITISANSLKRDYEKKQKDLKLSHVTENVGIERDELFLASLDFCDLMRYEFLLCKPCQNLNNMIHDAFDRLCMKEILSQPEKIYTEDEQMAKRIAHRIEYEENCFDDEEEDEEGNFYQSRRNHNATDEELVYFPSEKHCDRIVLMSILAPFSSTYAAVAFCLNSLIGSNSMVEGEFIKLCVKEITTRVDLGECKYGESISVDSIRNCLKILEKRSYIEITNNNGVRIIQLSSDHDTTMGVQTIIQRLEKYVPS